MNSIRKFLLHFWTKASAHANFHGTILDAVDGLQDQSRRAAVNTAELAQFKRIESERLWAEAEALQAEANRLETLSRNLAELTGLPSDPVFLD